MRCLLHKSHVNTGKNKTERAQWQDVDYLIKTIFRHLNWTLFSKLADSTNCPQITWSAHSQWRHVTHQAMKNSDKDVNICTKRWEQWWERGRETSSVNISWNQVPRPIRPFFPLSEPHRGLVGSWFPVHVLLQGQCRDREQSPTAVPKTVQKLNTKKIFIKVKSAKMWTIFIHSLGVYRAFSIAFKIPCLKINTMSKKAILQIQSFVAIQCSKCPKREEC